MKRFLAAFLALVADAASPVGKVVSLLQSMEGEILEEGKAEEKKITKYTNMCEKRTADLEYQIKTAKTDIEELTARISKADGKAEAAASSIQETQQSIAADEADLKAAGEVRAKESAEFIQAQKELLEVTATVE